SVGLPRLAEILVRLSAQCVDLLLHRRLVAFDESDPVERCVHGRGFELPRERLPDNVPGFLEAVETGVGGGQERVAGSRIGIEANRGAGLVERLVESAELVVLERQIVVRRGVARIRALPQLQRLEILLQLPGDVVVVTRGDVEALALADSLAQLEGPSRS